jgi:protein-tyrosine phosphatase
MSEVAPQGATPGAGSTTTSSSQGDGPTEPNEEARHLDWPACLNARDLGGLITKDGGRICDGVLVRSDRLSRLTPTGVDAVRRIVPGRIIDLRAARQCEREPNPFAGTDLYWHVPLSDPADTPDRQPYLIDRYRSKLDRNPRRFANAVAAVADAPPGTVVVHCQAGKDRTGLVIALILSAVGVLDEAIAADYAVSASRLDAHYRAKRARIDDPELLELVHELHSACPDTMLATLAHVRAQYGGAEQYLRHGGLTRRQSQALRTRLLNDRPHRSAPEHGYC